jgi:hypothetical protein
MMLAALFNSVQPIIRRCFCFFSSPFYKTVFAKEKPPPHHLIPWSMGRSLHFRSAIVSPRNVMGTFRSLNTTVVTSERGEGKSHDPAAKIAKICWEVQACSHAYQITELIGVWSMSLCR